MRFDSRRMMLWEGKTEGRSILHEALRVCDECKSRFLSGFVKIERGYPVWAICRECGGGGIDEDGRHLTKPAPSRRARRFRNSN